MSDHVTRKHLNVDGEQYEIFPFDGLQDRFPVASLPFSLKVLLENLLRHADEEFVQSADIEALANWDPEAEPEQEIAFVPARVLLQDFTGVPAIVDLATMRDAMAELGGEPERINPLSPVELVIDHSVMVDHFGSRDAMSRNTAIEIDRNRERYQFLRWGQQAFDNFKVVPPGTGIVHQVNLEYLARGVFTTQGKARRAYPDTLVGTDSHTTMINGLGVLGWGVGGIEAEAAMLGQPVTMLIPQVVGFRLKGRLPEGATATDLVLTVTQMLREHGVVGKFVEFFGEGLGHLSLADRATIANMAPEYGATCGIFPVDEETLNYLRLTGRDEHTLNLTREYMQAMGMWHDADTPEARYSAVLELQLDTVEPSLAGPSRPQDRVPLKEAGESFRATLKAHHARSDKVIASGDETDFLSEGGDTAVGHDRSERADSVRVKHADGDFLLNHGAVVIAAITSCTNTSNPAVLVGAGLLARKARELGLATQPWVKTSLAPGSQVVTDYLDRAGLLPDLEALGFHVVGYGCTTCIGNSGPLAPEISEAVRAGDLLVSAVLSGNRNFEGRIHADVRANYLASPPLVVAYALAGTVDIDLDRDPIGTGSSGRPVYLRDIWPSSKDIGRTMAECLDAELFRSKYADVYRGTDAWRKLPVSDSDNYTWPESTYVRKPPFFTDISAEPPGVSAIENARCLVRVGDSITTDHISPAGAIDPESPAGQYLQEQGVKPVYFNSYGSRRGNHEVMMRGTFANVRLKNRLAPGTEGCWTCHIPSGEQVSIYEAAMRYRDEETPLIVLAGAEYGTGSSRDWAAKGPALLGVRAVIAESFERIHRSNLVGMGILPLQFVKGDSVDSLGLDGTEQFSIPAISPDCKTVTVQAEKEGGDTVTFEAIVRIDTPNEFAYYEHGGILQYVLRRLAA